NRDSLVVTGFICSDNGNCFASLYQVSYLAYSIEQTCARRTYQAFNGIAANGAWHTCVRLSIAMQVDTSQVVPTICLNDGVHVFASFVARTKGDDNGRIVHRYTTIVLRERCLDQCCRMHLLEQCTSGGNNNGHESTG